MNTKHPVTSIADTFRRMQMSRRAVTAAFLGSAAGGIAARSSSYSSAFAQRATPSASPTSTHIPCGINYDVGTEFLPGLSTRPAYQQAFLEQELKVIRDDLHAPLVGIFGSTIDRLATATEIAIASGLDVRFQPRLINVPSVDELITSTVYAAAFAEAFSTGDREVVFDIGCELTLFAYGIVPGETYDERVAHVISHVEDSPSYSDPLNEFFAQVVPEVRNEFGGRITYSAGEWETVDWALFDIVGIDLYRDQDNAAGFESSIRALQEFGKPVWVNEFGCCTFKGAEDLGGSGYAIVNYETDPPTIPEEFVRDETIQAETILDLLGIFESEGVSSASVYQFISTDMPFNNDPTYDLDTASFAIVKNWGADSDKSYDETGFIEPKKSFQAIAEYNREIASAL